jgi:hypothetical protein
LGGGMVAGYAAKQLVENGLKPGELGIDSARLRDRLKSAKKGFYRNGSGFAKPKVENSGVSFECRHALFTHFHDPCLQVNACKSLIACACKALISTPHHPRFPLRRGV